MNAIRSTGTFERYEQLRSNHCMAPTTDSDVKGIVMPTQIRGTHGGLKRPSAVARFFTPFQENEGMQNRYLRAKPLHSLAIILFLFHASSAHAALEFYVSISGSDANTGTRERPFASLDHVRQIISERTDRSQPITVFLAGGTYYLPDTLVFQPADSGTKDAPITYAAFPGQTPIISGGQKLQLAWTPYKNGIMQAPVPAGMTADQLFVNGEPRSWRVIQITTPMPRHSTARQPTHSARRGRRMG